MPRLKEMGGQYASVMIGGVGRAGQDVHARPSWAVLHCVEPQEA